LLRNRKWGRLFAPSLVLLLATAALVGCAADDKADVTPTEKTITDMGGRTVTVPSKIERVLSSGPPGGIILYTLCPDKMVGWNTELREGEKRFIKEKYQKLPVVGGWYAKNTGNVEEILKVKPEVVICMGYMDENSAKQADTIQEQLGIPVVLADWSLTKMDKTYEFLGDLLGEKEAAKKMAKYCKDTVSDIQEKSKKIEEGKRVSVYYAEGAKGLQTDPKGSQHTEVLDLVGGVNIANVELKGGMGMSEVSLEQVLAWDPDVIITWNQEQSGYYPQLLEDPKWKELKAVKEGKVYEIPCAPFSWFDRPPSVNRILGLKWLGNALYPDIYNYDLTKEIKEFYSLFYHSDISDQDAKDLLKNAVPKK
jgi:iron complex transport system substrate-binding protein